MASDKRTPVARAFADAPPRVEPEPMKIEVGFYGDKAPLFETNQRYMKVTFKLGDTTITVCQSDNVIEVRTAGFAKGLAILPRSSNVVEVKEIDL